MLGVPTRSRPKISQRKKNNGRAVTGIDHNVRARIAHLADKSENDLKQMAADYASYPSDCANGRTSSDQWDIARLHYEYIKAQRAEVETMLNRLLVPESASGTKAK